MSSVSATTPAVSAAAIAVGATPGTDVTTVAAIAVRTPGPRENSHSEDDCDAKHHCYHEHPRHSPAPTAYELKDRRA